MLHGLNLFSPLLPSSPPPPGQAPWGGIKNSGHGRELGDWGLENFLSVKQITRYVNPGIWEWYPQGASKL